MNHFFLFFSNQANRLQTTTVKTTWNEASTEPVNTGIFRTSTHSHSVVNGHAHAQVCTEKKKNAKFIASKPKIIADLFMYLFIHSFCRLFLHM